MTIEAAAQQPTRRPSGGNAGGFVPSGAERVLHRAIDWLRANLFSSLSNTLLTLIVLAVAALILPPFFEWAITGATISGTSKAACVGDGACWTFIKVRFPLFFYGHYPPAETWRIDVAGLLLVIFSVPVIRESSRRRGRWLLLLLTVFPVLAGILLIGGVPGLPYVDTSQWGGLMLDVLIAFLVVEGALPLGILLALGRRSRLPIIRLFSTGFIELWRGVPLLTVISMSAIMVPLFLPDGFSIDRLVRALVALVLFNAAYMAETIRGGLQGVPAGQEEAAYAVGLSWWQVQAFVIVPQAIRNVLPGIVNNIVDLFKDTTLVTIIGLSDLLGTVMLALKDPAWLGLAKEGYVFAMLAYFLCCFVMSTYARRVERRLTRHRSA